jgi:hypothetical protein
VVAQVFKSIHAGGGGGGGGGGDGDGGGSISVQDFSDMLRRLPTHTSEEDIQVRREGRRGERGARGRWREGC